MPSPNPTLELHDGNGALLALNDNWRDSQEAAMIATGLAPTEDAESAIVATLPGSPGGIGYTAIVRGANGSHGDRLGGSLRSRALIAEGRESDQLRARRAAFRERLLLSGTELIASEGRDPASARPRFV